MTTSPNTIKNASNPIKILGMTASRNMHQNYNCMGCIFKKFWKGFLKFFLLCVRLLLDNDNYFGWNWFIGLKFLFFSWCDEWLLINKKVRQMVDQDVN